MEKLRVLEEARNLISDPDNWTRNVYAKTAEGISIAVHNKRAARFCAIGAVARVLRINQEKIFDEPSEMLAIRRALYDSARKLGFPGIAHLNDAADHSKVLEMYDGAITEEKRNGAIGACSGSYQGYQ